MTAQEAHHRFKPNSLHMAGLHGLSGHLITGYDSCLVPGTIEIPAKAPGEVGQVCYCYTLGRWEHKKKQCCASQAKIPALPDRLCMRHCSHSTAKPNSTKLLGDLHTSRKQEVHEGLEGRAK